MKFGLIEDGVNAALLLFDVSIPIKKPPEVLSERIQSI